MDCGKGTGTVNAAPASFRTYVSAPQDPGGSGEKRQEGSHRSRFNSDHGNRLGEETVETVEKTYLQDLIPSFMLQVS